MTDTPHTRLDAALARANGYRHKATVLRDVAPEAAAKYDALADFVIECMKEPPRC